VLQKLKRTAWFLWLASIHALSRKCFVARKFLATDGDIAISSFDAKTDDQTSSNSRTQRQIDERPIQVPERKD
jgi:hypothetical protein